MTTFWLYVLAVAGGLFVILHYRKYTAEWRQMTPEEQRRDWEDRIL